MVRVEPGGERAVRRPELEDRRGVGDGGVHLEPVADDARVGQESPPVAGAVCGHDLWIEAAVGLAERVALLEDREPGEAGLVDLQHQSLEQLGVAREREAVLLVVIGPVPFVAGGDVAVGDRHSAAGYGRTRQIAGGAARRRR